ncbi:MAG TPA: NmrA family NAD(P)-binding protein [Bryobacteraceae bacterium]|nr:NmrA family NAD(P)-binding protein [Bryobacteraceae bacterium]
MEPLFVVTGATGHTGSVVARTLLAAGKRVRAVGRDAGRLEPLTSAGAERFVCDLADSKSLAPAFTGAHGVYAVIPPDITSPDYRAYQDRTTDSIAAALKKARVPYAVTLSSVGAHHSAKTGPIVGLYYMERQLNRINGLNVLHLRAGYFMENLLAQVAIIKSTGNAAGTVLADLPLPLIATRDIGAAAADALLQLSFQGHQTRELLGQRDVTMAEAAGIIGSEIGKPDLRYQQSPQSSAREVLMGIGVSANVADLILEMSAAMNSGLVAPTEARSPANTTSTSLETFVHEQFLPAYRGMASSG